MPEARMVLASAVFLNTSGSPGIFFSRALLGLTGSASANFDPSAAGTVSGNTGGIAGNISGSFMIFSSAVGLELTLSAGLDSTVSVFGAGFMAGLTTATAGEGLSSVFFSSSANTATVSGAAGITDGAGISLLAIVGAAGLVVPKSWTKTLGCLPFMLPVTIASPTST